MFRFLGVSGIRDLGLAPVRIHLEPNLRLQTVSSKPQEDRDQARKNSTGMLVILLSERKVFFAIYKMHIT